jgi:hypothetical protein
MDEDIKRAAHLFGAYFHQDWMVDDPDWESVVVHFRESEPFALVRATQDSLQRILEQSTEADLDAFLFGARFLSYYDPRPEGLSLHGWLEGIVHLLAGGAPRSSDGLRIAQARRRAALVAQEALGGARDPVVAALELCGLRSAVGVPEDDSDFACFMLINSETDALPLETERSQWSAEALARLEPEVTRARDWARAVGDPAFENVVRRFGGAKRQA